MTTSHVYTFFGTPVSVKYGYMVSLRLEMAKAILSFLEDTDLFKTNTTSTSAMGRKCYYHYENTVLSNHGPQAEECCPPYQLHTCLPQSLRIRGVSPVVCCKPTFFKKY